MKVKRYKHCRKYLGFYRNNFNFREPHQVLVDGTFTQLALKNKINIREQLPKYLGGEVQLVVTDCILREAESLGRAVYGGYIILKRFQVRRCGHRDQPVTAHSCIMSMVADNNNKHYFVATQDPDLSAAVNSNPGTPLLYVHYNAMVLEKPSTVSMTTASMATTAKINPSDFEKSTLTRLKGESDSPDVKQRKKRRGPKGPNPLSVKKKKKKSDEGLPKGEGGATEGRKKRRRKRMKISPHVKEHMAIMDSSS